MDTPDGRVPAHWPTWLVVAVVAVAYSAGAAAAFLALDATSVVVLFLPAGVSLSALVLTGRRQWPWILATIAVAEVTVDLANGIQPLAAVGFALANTAEPLVGATLLRGAVGRQVDLRRHRDTLAFVSYCVLGAPLVGGAIGATTLYLSLSRPWFDSFLSFWAGDGLGVLAVGGAILTWRHLRPITGRRVVGLLVALGAILAATVIGFWLPGVPLFYLPVPLLFVIAVRFPLPVLTACGLLMTITANVLTSADRGPWAALASTPQLEVATLQLFMGTTVAGAWFLAVSIAERDVARSATAAERAVRQRIQGLQAVTAQLAKAVTSDSVAEILAARGITLIADHGAVAVRSRDGRSISIRPTPNRPPGLMVRYRGVPMTEAMPLTQVVQTGDRILEQTVAGLEASFPALAELRATLEIRSGLCVPVRDGDDGTVGALAFGFSEEYAIDADTVTFAETLASLTGQALRRSRLYDAEYETARQLQRQADALNAALREQEELQRELTFRALHDPLTGLANRQVLVERLEAVLSQGDPEHPAALFLMDLDDFKAVNDTYGHGIGDSVLIEAARRLSQVAPPGSLTVRLGGDEFAVLAADASARTARTWADQLRGSFLRPFLVDGLELQISASIGVALTDAAEPSNLMSALRDADLALYAAKDGGRDRTVLFQPALRSARLERTELATGLRHADFDTEFDVVYQPVVDLADGRPAWIEALARWTRPDGRPVPPDAFIPLAEETGKIHALGAWVLRRALADSAALLLPAREPHLSLSVNISSRQLETQQFADLVLRELSAAGVPASSLILEITETMLVTLSRAHGSAIAQLHRLRQHGVRIALDDFGTGYSSLSTISRLPVDVVKLDRSFSRETAGRSRGPRRRFLRAVIHLAESLDLQIVAEGVETQAQADLLRQLSCPLGQGNLFAAPASIQAHAALLDGNLQVGGGPEVESDRTQSAAEPPAV